MATPALGSYVFRHVVMFRWAEGVDQTHVDEVTRRLDELPPAITLIRSYLHGPDAGVNDGDFDFVVVADFDSVDDYITFYGTIRHTVRSSAI